MKFIIFSEYGEILDIAMHLKFVEKHEVIMHISGHDQKKIGNGIIEKEDNWWRCVGKGYIWVFDGCSNGDLQDWLRERGELVVGGSRLGDKMENERQMNQKWFEKAGFDQPFSKNFKNIDELIAFVKEHKETRWILKQNGDAPKSLNHMGKFDNSKDMIFHLEELKKSWSEESLGKFDMDIMEIVEGMELAVSVFFNGKNYLKNSEGKVAGYLNFEEKKETDGGQGATTGEMGTTFIGVDENNKLFKRIILNPEIIRVLRKMNFRGVFDINCILKKDGGIVALEPTMRFGIPATSYEFIEGLNSNLGELLSTIAKGENNPVEIHKGFGMVMCVVSKPFPLEGDLEDEMTSLGEKLWILNNGQPVDEFSDDQRIHIHLENFEKDEFYKVATKSGYLLTVTNRGENIKTMRENLIEYIKENINITDMKFRTDIGKRVEVKGVKNTEDIKNIESNLRANLEENIKQEYNKKLEQEKTKHKIELDKIKKFVKKNI